MSTRCREFGRRIYAYGGEGEPEEYGREYHNVVESPTGLKLLPLDATGSNKEANKDTYTTGSLLAQNLNSLEISQTLTIQHTLEEGAKKERQRVTHS